MPETFYVVSAESADADEYTGAVAFNRTDKDADNEEAAREYLTERKAAAPWHSHAVMSADDFAAYNDHLANKGDETDPANDGTPADATD
jgi:hypothetical protein